MMSLPEIKKANAPKRRPRVRDVHSQSSFRDCLLVEIAMSLERLAGVLCHAQEMAEFRKHTVRLTLVQLQDAGLWLGKAAEILNPE